MEDNKIIRMEKREEKKIYSVLMFENEVGSGVTTRTNIEDETDVEYHGRCMIQMQKSGPGGPVGSPTPHPLDFKIENVFSVQEAFAIFEETARKAVSDLHEKMNKKIIIPQKG